MFGNTNTSTFGTGSLFGQNAQQPQQQPQQTSGTTSFGGWGVTGTTGAFNTTPTGTNMFGTSGSPTTTSIFGQNASNNTGGGIFGGQQNATTSTTPTNFFGGGGGTTTGSTGFTTGTTGSTNFFQGNNSTNSAGTSVRFDVIKEQDTLSKNGVPTKITVGYQCITIMPQYKDKSFEELRYEDYQLNRHKKTATLTLTGGGLFGGIGTSTTTTTPPVAPPQPTGGLFGSILGQQWPTSTQNTNANTSSTSGLFSNLFNPTAQQKPATNLFGSPSTFGSTATAATGGTSGATTSPFNFTNTTQQGQGQPTTSIFGTPPATQATTTATTTPTFTFGQATTGTTGTLNLFGNQNQQQTQQQPQNNGFNFTAAAATVTTTGPGLFGTASPTTNKPLFGSGTGTTTTAPPPSGFFTAGAQQQQQQNTAATQFGTFGATNKTVTFGTTTTPTFGSTALGTSSLGPSAGTSTSQGTQQPSISFGFNATTQQQQQSVAPAPSSFGMFGSPSTIGTTGSSFRLATASGTYGSTGGFVLQAPISMMQVTRMPIYHHPQYMTPPGPITFGTSAFKDSPLFYNLHENVPSPKPGERRKRLDMPPADNEIVQKYVPKSSSHHLPSNFTSLPLFRRQTCLVKNKNSSISKFKIFDGFEDEDFGVGIDILSPKTDVKRLSLKTLEESLGCIFPLGNKNSPSLARRSTELIAEKNSNETPTRPPPEAQQACSSSSVLGNRRVRFLLPPSTKPGQEKDDDNDDDESFRLGSHFGSSSVSLLETGTCFNGSGGGQGAGDFAFLQSSGSDESIVGVGGSTSFTNLVNGSVGKGNGRVCGLISSRDSYYVKPSVHQLNDLVDLDGNCFVEDFEIGRRNFGRIKFLCPVNVANVNIDELVNFRHKEVVVYPDDSKKPEIGQGLNVPAEIRLERVWPVDKETNELVRGVDNIKQRGYAERLRRSCKRMGVQFISYDAEDGIWCFRVTHF